jgi:four helix bundle protein
MRKVSEFPDCSSKDPVARMRVYQLAWKLRPASLEDTETIRRCTITSQISGQLYAAVGSIASNIVEGYSRSSGRDRARFFEYALGSTREAIEWYESSRYALEADVLRDRLAILNEIARMLLAIIPRERNRIVRPSKQ